MKVLFYTSSGSEYTEIDVNIYTNQHNHNKVDIDFALPVEPHTRVHVKNMPKEKCIYKIVYSKNADCVGLFSELGECLRLLCLGNKYKNMKYEKV